MHISCPHCGNPVEVLESSIIVACPSCGSQFDVATDETLSFLEQHITERPMIAHFRLMERLGLGGFGTVFLAWDAQLDREVALKIPHGKRTGGEVPEMMLHEARSAAQLQHPNIVTVYEIGTADGTAYIASELIRGVTLREAVSQRTMSFREKAELMIKVARAIEHAHQQGVIHRDLKPGNIMLDVRGEPHVMDFGLAKRGRPGEITITQGGEVVGTPAYLPPEQARGESKEADERSDVYGLGIVLYELLTGKRAFQGTSRTLLLEAVKSKEPPAPRAVDRRIPRDLETICLKAMSKEKGNRFGSAKEFADDLQRYLDGQPIRARPVSLAERQLRWLRRNSRAAIVVSTVLILASALVAALMTRPRTATPFAQQVVFVTEPVGALLKLDRIDESTMLPFENSVPIEAEEKTPCIMRLEPGYYRIYAETANRHHLVYRTIPAELDRNEGSQVKRHRYFQRLEDGRISVPSIRLWRDDEVVSDMALVEGGRFTRGAGELHGLPEHEVEVEAFYIDLHEVTVAECREVIERLPSVIEDDPDITDQHPVTHVTYDSALGYAEAFGKSLPTDVQYEYVATNKGTTRYPWGDDLGGFDTWIFGATGVVALDRTATSPAIYGLYSNVAEWTDSAQIPYPGSAIDGSGKSQLQQQFKKLRELNLVSRVVKGGTFDVVQGQPGEDWKAGPATRTAVLMDTMRPGLGFRCVRVLRSPRR